MVSGGRLRVVNQPKSCPPSAPMIATSGRRIAVFDSQDVSVRGYSAMAPELEFKLQLPFLVLWDTLNDVLARLHDRIMF